MRKIIFIVTGLFFLSFNSSFSQNSRSKLIGVWQVGSTPTGDAWRDNYRFFADGTFKYTFNQYDDRGRILSASGTYKLKRDTLFLTIKTRKERVGGDLVGGSPGFQQDELVLDGGKVAEVKQKNTAPIDLLVEWFIKKDVRGFKIQNNRCFLT